MYDFAAKYSAGLSYDGFLAAHGTAEHQRRWREVYDRVQLDDEQAGRLADFRREMKVLCLAGAWCGDCVEQCPVLVRLAQASDCIDLRFFDRDLHPDLADELRVCGGSRVPAVVFLSEDGHHVGRYGDRTLAKYRSMAAQLSGPACPTGLVPQPDQLLHEVTNEWINEFERVQLILRTSPRLREKHGD